MESSLEDEEHGGGYQFETADLHVSYPLNQCLRELKEKFHTVSRLHKERFEQVKKLVQALESYSLHLEQSFIRIKLPPTSANTCPPNFDLSPRFVAQLDEEFSRVYDEYNRRIQTVQGTAEEIVRLYSDLGIPQAQTDSNIVKYYRDSPEQLGLHQSDLDRLRSKHEKLMDEKRNREKRIKELRAAVEGLWDRLSIEDAERRAFLANTRGCGLRTINELEEELARLNELKRQNLHLFVEDARLRLQDLWDALFFSEEEMLEFTPAFSDVYSDALLSAHEAEIERLQALQEQRAPILAVIEKHRSLIRDREALASSANDASRLMARGAKGERRDPTRLLREEKMRKRIAKELPKVAAELQDTLARYEDEYGRPFLVHGERYLDELAAAEAKAPPPRSKTPNALPPRSKTPSVHSASVSRTNGAVPAANGTIRSRGGHPPSASATMRNTPTSAVASAGSLRTNPNPSYTQSTSSHPRSPSKIPARAPLSNLYHGANSPERRTHIPQWSGSSSRTPEILAPAGKMGPPRIPPPKMRDLETDEFSSSSYRHAPPPRPGSVLSSSTMVSTNNNRSNASHEDGLYVRPVSPEDVYRDGEQPSYMSTSLYHRDHAAVNRHCEGRERQHPHAHHEPQHRFDDFQSSVIRYREDREAGAEGDIHSVRAFPPHQNGSRDVSNTSSDLLTSATTASSSENWETYSDASQPDGGPEIDTGDVYYAKIRQQTTTTSAAAAPAATTRTNPSIKRAGDGGGTSAPRAPKMRLVSQESDGQAIAIEGGSDAGWTDVSTNY